MKLTYRLNKRQQLITFAIKYAGKRTKALIGGEVGLAARETHSYSPIEGFVVGYNISVRRPYLIIDSRPVEHEARDFSPGNYDHDTYVASYNYKHLVHVDILQRNFSIDDDEQPLKQSEAPKKIPASEVFFQKENQKIENDTDVLQLKARIDILRASEAELKSEINALGDEATKATVMAAGWKKRCAELETMNNRLANDYESQTAKCAAMEREFEALKKSLMPAAKRINTGERFACLEVD